MSWLELVPAPLRRPLRRVRRRPPAAADASEQWFGPEQIDGLRRTYYRLDRQSPQDWQRWRDAHLVLPDWFEHGLDPWGKAYATQQHRLWALMTGAEQGYDPDVHERETGWSNVDPFLTPGYYARRDAHAIASASDHIIATGMILKHCGLQAGDRALEYGAGYGHTALALARLGVRVDTVDISKHFCEAVRVQAKRYAAPLTPFHGRFGLNPRPGERYKLIWFYESFHHCLDFAQAVPKLAEHLDDGGRVILAGEPIFEREYAGVPYPWGVRLHSEVAAVMRHTGWFELGFTEAFLYELFARAGFAGRRIDCEPSLFGRLYVFERATPRPR